MITPRRPCVMKNAIHLRLRQKDHDRLVHFPQAPTFGPRPSLSGVRETSWTATARPPCPSGACSGRLGGGAGGGSDGREEESSCSCGTNYPRNPGESVPEEVYGGFTWGKDHPQSETFYAEPWFARRRLVIIFARPTPKGGPRREARSHPPHATACPIFARSPPRRQAHSDRHPRRSILRPG